MQKLSNMNNLEIVNSILEGQNYTYEDYKKITDNSLYRCLCNEYVYQLNKSVRDKQKIKMIQYACDVVSTILEDRKKRAI